VALRGPYPCKIPPPEVYGWRTRIVQTFSSNFEFDPRILPPRNMTFFLALHVARGPTVVSILKKSSKSDEWNFCYAPQTLKFPDISSQYLRSIDPCNSTDTKRNAYYFSLQYSYILSQLRQLCSSVDTNGIIHYCSPPLP